MPSGYSFQCKHFNPPCSLWICSARHYAQMCCWCWHILSLPLMMVEVSDGRWRMLLLLRTPQGAPDILKYAGADHLSEQIFSRIMEFEWSLPSAWTFLDHLAVTFTYGWHKWLPTGAGEPLDWFGDVSFHALYFHLFVLYCSKWKSLSFPGLSIVSSEARSLPLCEHFCNTSDSHTW